MKLSILFRLVTLSLLSSNAIGAENGIIKESSFEDKILTLQNSEKLGIDIELIRDEFRRNGVLRPGNTFMINPYFEDNEIDFTNIDNITITLELKSLDASPPPNWDI